MSYILDALKKLEQKRQQGGTITLLSSQGNLPAKSKPRRIWIYLLLLALVLNAGIFAWWVGPWRSAAGKKAPQRTSAPREAKPPLVPAMGAAEPQMETVYIGEKQPPPAKSEKQSANDETATGNSTPRPAPEPVPAPGRTPPAAGKPQPAPTGTAALQKLTAAQKPSPVEQVYSEPPVRSEPKPPKDGRVQKIADLPASISSGLPEFKISLHYYIADHKSRFARINDKTLREGEFLAEGLKVDEITAAGVVMNCRGWRFLLGISNEK